MRAGFSLGMAKGLRIGYAQILARIGAQGNIVFRAGTPQHTVQTHRRSP
jgi:hypothetical protein